jgi:hypothetical protein
MGVILLVKGQRVAAKERHKVLSAEQLTPVHPSMWQVLTTADKGLIVVIVLAAAGLFAYQSGEVREGCWVRLQAAGQVQILSLEKDAYIEVIGPLGTSRIEIGTQGARFSEAPCFHKLCIKQGWIRFAGQVVACIPNQMILAVQGDPLTNGLDAVSR